MGALEKVFSSNFISTRTTYWRFVGSITSSIFMATVESMLNRKPKEKSFKAEDLLFMAIIIIITVHNCNNYNTLRIYSTRSDVNGD